MRGRALRFALMGSLALLVAVGSAAGGAQAKKKGRAGGTAEITKTVNASVPDAVGNTSGMLVSTIDIGGRKFKGTRVRDVNVTVQTTGAISSSAQDIAARLTAPNGATSWLFADLEGQSIGPLTLDDQTPIWLNIDSTPQDVVPGALGVPYAGTAQPDCIEALGGCPLGVMNDTPASGIWTLRVHDTSHAAPGRTSVLNLWRLRVVAGKPYQTK
jgi:subtilisin-like proprotein convertase family protein